MLDLTGTRSERFSDSIADRILKMAKGELPIQRSVEDDEIVMLDQELRRGNREEPTLTDYQGIGLDQMILLELSTADLLLDPSTSMLPPIAKAAPEGGERGGGRDLTPGSGSLADLADSDRIAERSDAMAQPPEPSEGLPSEPTVQLGQPDAVGRWAKDLGFAVRSDGLAMARPGAAMGDYELLKMLGQGGMGVVFKARQKSLNRDVALKMINAGRLADDRQVRLFQIEAEAIAALDHPHIVPILDTGNHLGLLYYTMKLIDGRNLAVSLDRFRDQPMAIARLMVRVAEAIHHAHQRGVLHRDLKPSNILVDEQGEPHVIDFGLAKRLGEGTSVESSSSHPMGTPTFMSPEQTRRRPDEITTATDVYGLGTILYTLLAGRPPFSGTSVPEVFLQITDQDPPPPHDRNSNVNRDLETICLKCLRKDPWDRYASARDLADDLNRWIEGRPIVARPASKVERAVKWVRRRPEIAALSAAVVILTMLGLAGIIWIWIAAITARDESLIIQHLTYKAILNLAQDKADRSSFEWYYLDRMFPSQDGALAGEEDIILRMAYSRDGCRLALASRDRTIKIWDTVTGQVIRTLRASKPVLAMVFHPDGTRLASAGTDRVITLWDARTDQAIRTSPGHTKEIDHLAFSPDGKTLASSSLDGMVKLWDVATGSLVRSLDDHHLAAAEIIFSPDGKTLISVGIGETTARIWDVATGQIVHTLKGAGQNPEAASPSAPAGSE
jgi:tRNA A-37 threonylcarbamoyl transferase component Bud32